MSATDGRSASADGEDMLQPDERAELDRPRSQVSEFRQTERRRRIGWRAPVATLLIVLGCLLAPLSVIGVWTANEVSDTSRYVATLVGYSDLAANELASRGLPKAKRRTEELRPADREWRVRLHPFASARVRDESGLREAVGPA